MDALRFELGKVEVPSIRERVLAQLAQVDRGLAGRVAEGLGMDVPAKVDGPLNQSMPADADPKDYQPRRVKPAVERSAALSMANTVKDTAKSRRVAILAADGVDAAAVETAQRLLAEAGAQGKIVAPHGGTLAASRGARIPVDFTLLTVGSVLFDAVFVPGGDQSAKALADEAAARLFVAEAYKHCKTIAVMGAGAELLPGGVNGQPASRGSGSRAAEDGVLVGGDGQVDQLVAGFIEAIAQHRHWSREPKGQRIAV